MKKKILIIILFAVFHNSFGQNAYYDAIKLRKHISNNIFVPDTANLNAVAKILKPYLNNPPANAKNASQILSLFQQPQSPNYNIFIAPYINLNGVAANLFTNLSGQSDKGNPLSSIGGLDVTNFADGLAKFMVERAKQELSIAFFERFKTDLDNVKQIKILFPATHKALIAIDKEIYNYSAYLSLLRESFQKDLVVLIPNLGKLVDDECMNVIFNDYPEIRTILSDGLFIVNEFNDGKHPGEVIHNYISTKADSASLEKINYLYPSLQTFDLFSQSLRSKQEDQYWISADSLKLLFKDSITTNIYLGLIYQQAKIANITFGDKPFTDFLKNTITVKNRYQSFITGLISKAKDANSYFKAIKEKQDAGKEKPNYQDYYSLYDASINFLEQLSKIPLPKLVGYDSTKFDNYFLTARSIGNIYVDVYEKQYTSAIVELGSIYSVLLDDKIKARITSIQDTIDNPKWIVKEKKAKFDAIYAEIKDLKCDTIYKTNRLDIIDTAIKILKSDKEKKWILDTILSVIKNFNSDEKEAILDTINKKFNNLKCIENKKTAQLKSDKKKLEDILKASSLILKYGTFVATIAKAENSDEVQKAIESIALPTGSSRIKRETKFNVSINSYVGLFYGRELIKGAINQPFLNSYGVTAPIGVALNWGGMHCCKHKGGHSLSIFMSIIDIGALAAFRVSDDSTSALPKIELKDIISPGVFLSWGIAKSPISISAGVQMGPLLRKVAPSVNTYGYNKYIRCSLSVLVDIPLLNLYTKPLKN